MQVQAKNCLSLGTPASAVTCQSKGRRLQKSAQVVEDMEEEGLGGKAVRGGGIGIIGEGGEERTQRNGERCCSNQLKHQDAKSMGKQSVINSSALYSVIVNNAIYDQKLCTL